MKQSSFTTQILTPDKGMILTQSADIDIKNRIFSDKLYLGVNDSPDNWKEITEQEADRLKEEQRAAIEAEQEVKE